VSAAAITLAEEQLDVLADRVAIRVADLLRGDGAPPANSRRLVSAAEVARELGMSRAYVYEHARELGAQRFGDGPRARLRFDLEAIRTAGDCLIGKQPHGQIPSAGAKNAPRATPRRRRSPNGAPEPGSVLAVRPRRSAGTERAA
jgi:hypothetical protein